ncbi:MAG: hypothetical protein AAF675_18735 [Pseudomonadota bacterium]
MSPALSQAPRPGATADGAPPWRLPLTSALVLSLAVALPAAGQDPVVSALGGAPPATPDYGEAVRRDAAGGTWRRLPGEQNAWRLDNPEPVRKGRLELQADSLSRSLYSDRGAGIGRAGALTNPPR